MTIEESSKLSYSKYEDLHIYLSQNNLLGEIIPAVNDNYYFCKEILFIALNAGEILNNDFILKNDN